MVFSFTNFNLAFAKRWGKKKRIAKLLSLVYFGFTIIVALKRSILPSFTLIWQKETCFCAQRCFHVPYRAYARLKKKKKEQQRQQHQQQQQQQTNEESRKDQALRNLSWAKITKWDCFWHLILTKRQVREKKSYLPVATSKITLWSTVYKFL